MFSKKEEQGRFRVFNWNVPLSKGNHYECVFAVPGSDGTIKLMECKPTKKDLSSLANRSMTHKDWPGLLYYDIVPLSKKNDKEFILLGWDGNDELTNRKVIETISISEKNIRFGLNKFKEFPQSIKRYILEYSNEAIVSLNLRQKI